MSTSTASPDTISLNQLRIASPCTADWDAMAGDDRTRFCGECKLNVYNLSAMTEADASELIQKAEGRLCVRMYRRADGTVITQDCPVGLARLRKHARIAWMKVAAAFALITGGLAVGRVAGDAESTFTPGRDSIADLPGIRNVVQWLRPDPPPVIMGNIAAPPDPFIMGEIEAAPATGTRDEMGGARLPAHLDQMPEGGDCGVTPEQIPTLKGTE